MSWHMVNEIITDVKFSMSAYGHPPGCFTFYNLQEIRVTMLKVLQNSGGVYVPHVFLGVVLVVTRVVGYSNAAESTALSLS